MKSQGSGIVSKASLWAAIPLLFGILQCGAGTAIEQQSLDTGEGIILKFDGPFTYEYKVKGNPVAKSYTGSAEEQIALKNHYSDSDPQDTLEESLLAHAGITYDNKLSILMGPDMKIKNSAGSPVVPDGWDQTYKQTAYIPNVTRPADGALELDAPIEFSKNLVGITTVRKEKICVDGSGNPTPSFNNTAVPNLVCNPYHKEKETGKTLQFDYTVDQLKQLMGTSGERKNSLIYVWRKGDPLTLTLQNTKEVKIALSPAALGGFKQATPTFKIDPSHLGNIINQGPGDGNAPADPSNPGQNPGGADDALPVDSKVGGAEGGAPAGGAVTAAAPAQEGGKGCSLSLGAGGASQAWAGLAYLASLLAPAWMLRRRAR